MDPQQAQDTPFKTSVVNSPENVSKIRNARDNKNIAVIKKLAPTRKDLVTAIKKRAATYGSK
jgi:hypothetical protein